MRKRDRRPRAGAVPLHVHCPQCAALAINNVACHETGCPLARYAWKREGDNLVPGGPRRR